MVSPSQCEGCSQINLILVRTSSLHGDIGFAIYKVFWKAKALVGGMHAYAAVSICCIWPKTHMFCLAHPSYNLGLNIFYCNGQVVRLGHNTVT